MSTEDLEGAAAFLEQYALHPPRAAAHNPATDSPRWRGIQTKLRDLADRLRMSRDADQASEFTEADAQFLETQASRLWRMHHWIGRGPLLPAEDRMADAARMGAERLEALATMVRGRIRHIVRTTGTPGRAS